MTDRITLEFCENRREGDGGGRDTLLDVALDVHMTAVGSFDRSEERHTKDVVILQYALDHWKEGSPKSLQFDNAVRELIEAALEEDAIH